MNHSYVMYYVYIYRNICVCLELFQVILFRMLKPNRGVDNYAVAGPYLET
jgi:hypothetical protein